MAKATALGGKLYKYYIEDEQLKVVEGVLDMRKGKKWVVFGSNTVPDEAFPGYRNVGRVWRCGDILWMTERDDAAAKSLFTGHYVEIIKDLQRQIDEAGDRISMIRSMKVKSGNSKKSSKCFGEVSRDERSAEIREECKRLHQQGWDCSEFVDASQYAERKITMLKHEMFIDLSYEDEQHICSLTTRGAIDAAVRAIINKYWV